MREDDPNLLDPVEGELPSEEFVDDLWTRLETAWHSQADTESTDSSPPPIDLVLDEREQDMSSNKAWAAIAAVAAVIVVAVGVVAITGDDDNGQDPQVDSAATADGSDAEVEDDTAADGAADDAPSLDIEFTVIDLEHSGDVAPGDDFAWVSGRDAPVLTKIDLATGEVVSTIDMPATGRIGVVGFGSVWVGHADGTVSRFDAESDELQTTFDAGLGRTSWIDPGEEAVWVSGAGGVARIDPSTNEVVARIDGVGFVAMEGAGAFWAGNLDELGIARIDLSTNEVDTFIEGVGPGFGVGPDTVWAGGAEPGSPLTRIDGDTGTVTEEITVIAPDGTTATVLGAEVGGGWAWARFTWPCETPAEDGEECHGLARVDTATNEVVATAALPAGFSPGFQRIKVGPTTAWVSTDGKVARVDF